MTLKNDDRDAIRDRLEWLRILGLEEAPVRGAGPIVPQPPLAPPAGRQEPQEAPAGAWQQVLFGETVLPAAPDPTGPPAGRRARPGHPLADARLAAGDEPDDELRRIREDIGDCRRCRLCEQRTQVVFGVGSARARLMFVGEGPGADEDRQGEPFVGRAGQLLTKIIESIGLRREDVYIANVVKCRPPENRTPLPDEVATCSPFLFRQILAIRPLIIVCLGTPAAQAVLGTRETITRMRGTFREIEGFTVMPTFHPAYLLRNPAAKREVWEDMKQVMAALRSG
jgi:DNA polymerase